MPRPMVTAEVPSGSIRPTSTSLPRRGVLVIAAAARKPIVVAINAATTANRSDAPIEASGSTPRPAPGRVSAAPSRLHADSDQLLPTLNERLTSATIGAPTTTATPATAAPTIARSRRVRGTCGAVAPRSSIAPRRWRREAITITTPSSASCVADSAAAPETSPSCVARRATSTSSVGWVGPPSSLATPNEVKLNRKITAAADQSAGFNSGSTTSRAARMGDAPKVRAAPTRSCGITPTIDPTSRTTTAMLKNTWATIIASAVPCHDVGNRAMKAAPTTTVGSTNGTVVAAISSRRPRKL